MVLDRKNYHKENYKKNKKIQLDLRKEFINQVFKLRKEGLSIGEISKQIPLGKRFMSKKYILKTLLFCENSNKGREFFDLKTERKKIDWNFMFKSQIKKLIEAQDKKFIRLINRHLNY